MDIQPDRILIDKILEGDQLAFKELVEKYQTMIINTCIGFLHDKQDAEDIAQEVFVEVFYSLGKFRKEANLSTWLYRIAVNKSLNFLRSNKRRQWIQGFEDAMGIGRSGQTEPIETRHPGVEMETKEEAAMLHVTINSLSENQRIAFTLNKYEDLSYSEIAEVMGVSVSSVESLIHRAKINLQQKLMNYYKNR
jgi:RNA polymerase sigma-70 factor (ECF subfamily)